tara:strand:+ start:4180 stop:5580 length:1401 start_codon:yes stop_codon:yes gene_type:complete
MKVSYTEKELEILRNAVDKAEKNSGKRIISSPEIQKMIFVVENFLRKKKLICYGGTAINNILPDDDKFYDRETELPDYDFFSMNALEDAKELADIYTNEGFVEVEAKSGVHKGTYKVFVNFTPVADITQLDTEIYNNLFRDSINIVGIYYASANYLRMAMYLELSRPAGDVSRWEKVLKRLTLLNKNYPLKGHKCDEAEFQRPTNTSIEENQSLSLITRSTLINMGAIFFGGFAISLYSRYMPANIKTKFNNIPDFDVLSENPKRTADILKERLRDEGYKNVKVIHHNAIGEIVAPHYDIRIGNETVCFIYEPLACHSYNIIKIKGMNIKIATIDTMLSFYLAFLYTDRSYYDEDRILCMCEFLFKVQQKNRLEQKGLLKRFSIKCYGKQSTLGDMREEKAKKYHELKEKRGSKEWNEWFLRYIPNEIEEKTVSKKKTQRKTQKKKGKTKKTKKTKNNKFFNYFNQ